MVDKQGTILSAKGVHEFFRELVAVAVANQRARVQHATELYLVSLLSGFLHSEALFERDEDGALRQRPLAFLLKEALEEQGPVRAALLRKLGDTSLFLSGFFSESLSRSLVGVDYTIEMGSRAYDALGAVAARRGAAERTLWEELSSRFALLVELLNEVSERTLLSTNAGLVRIYERWMKTGSARLGGLLQQRGVPAILSVPRGRFAQ